MRNRIVIGEITSVGGENVIKPKLDGTPVVEVFEYDAGNPPNYTTGSALATTADSSVERIAGKGIWMADIAATMQVTVLVDGSPLEGYVGVLFEGDNQPFLDF